MSITLKINSVDRTNHIKEGTLRVEQIIDSQVDTCLFELFYDGVNKTVRPEVNDVVEVLDGATVIFAGIITDRNRRPESVGLLIYGVNCVSYERLFDRYLVADDLGGNKGDFVIRSIMNDYVNQTSKVLASMESGESWTDEGGSESSSIDSTNFIYGSRGRKATLATGENLTMRKEQSLDLDIFDDMNVSVDADKCMIGIRADRGSNLASVRVRFGEETGGTYTNYFEITFAGPFIDGWNYRNFIKSDMAEVGSPNFADIETVQLNAVAGAGGVVVTLDDLRMIKSDGFTMEGVQGMEVDIDAAAFNYEQVSDVLLQLANTLGYRWYVDTDRDLHFYPQSIENAPISLTDDSKNYIRKSLILKDDVSGIRNQIYVRGGDEIGNELVEDLSVQADGTNDIFNLGYRYVDYTVRVNAAVQSVGLDNIHLLADYDCLFNFNEKILRWKVAPAGGDVVTITAKPKIPIIIKKKDVASIDEHGVFEFLIQDKQLETRAACRQRAQSDLIAYRTALNEGGFQTFESGLRAGQQINISSTLLDASADYMISMLVMEMYTPTDPIYRIRLVSTRTFGIIELLIALLRNDAKGFDVNKEEVIDLVETFDEEITITEVVNVIPSGQTFNETVTIGETHSEAIDTPPTWVAGPYNPTNVLPTDPKRPMFCDRDNLLAS